MRAAYHSEYRPGAADTSELDPCIAAETRLKKSAFSTSKKRTFCLIGVLAVIFFIFLLLLIVFLSASPGKPSNIHTVGDFEYEDMESATMVRAPQPLASQPPTTTTTVVTTDRPPPPSTTHRRPSTTRPPPKQGKEIVVGRDEQPMEIHRVNLPVERPIPTTTSTTTATTTVSTVSPTTTKTTTRPTMRTRPSSVFPTAPLRASSDEIPFERKTEEVRESCTEHATAALGSGVYRISPGGKSPPFDVYCRMDEDDVVGEQEGVFRAGGAWTYVQSLSEEAYFYNRTFVEYESGFGRVDKSHWLGLDAMNRLAPGTAFQRPATLRIELYGDHCTDVTQCSGRPDGFWWGEWEFGLAPVDDLYRLHISPAQHGNLTVHNDNDVFYVMNNGRQFTTADRDNDSDEGVNCGQTRNYGGWWHKDCTFVALNGLYGDDKSKLRYQVWYRATMAGDPIKFSYHIHPKRSIMMVRPRL